MIRRRALWILGAAAVGVIAGLAYTALSTPSLRDPVAGAAAGLVAGALLAGWAEWGPRPNRS